MASPLTGRTEGRPAGRNTMPQVSGTGFKDLQAHDLGRIALHNLLKRTVLEYGPPHASRRGPAIHC